MEKKPSILYQNREYFYTLIEKTPTQITLSMYNTTYILVKEKEGWSNHHSCRYTLAPGLLQAAIETLKP